MQMLYNLFNLDDDFKFVLQQLADSRKNHVYQVLQDVFHSLKLQDDNAAKLLWLNKVLKWDWTKEDSGNLHNSENQM